MQGVVTKFNTVIATIYHTTLFPDSLGLYEDILVSTSRILVKMK